MLVLSRRVTIPVCVRVAVLAVQKEVMNLERSRVLTQVFKGEGGKCVWAIVPREISTKGVENWV